MKKWQKTLLTILLVLVLLVAMYPAYIAPKILITNDMSAMEGQCFAHRGYFNNASEAPENSLLSFQYAIDNGYGIELDVQLSSDGVPMVFHDADLMRVCGVEGKIWDYSCEELQKMKLLDSEETIPTMAQALELINGQVPLLVEYKMDKVDTAVCAKTQALLDEYDGDYVIQCFHPFALLWYEAKAPHVARGYLSKDFVAEKHADGKEPSILDFALSHMLLNFLMKPDFISYQFSDANHPALQWAQLIGAKTGCWTLKSQEDYESVKDQFDFYIFDSFQLVK